MDEIPISKLKAECLRILPKVNRSKDPIMVTKNGEPLVVIFPASKSKKRPPAGCLKGSAKILGDIIDFDTSKDWEVLK